MPEFKVTCGDEEGMAAVLRYKLREYDRLNNTWAHWLRHKIFWSGILIGMTVAAAFDLTDMHICYGECDGAGYDIIGNR